MYEHCRRRQKLYWFVWVNNLHINDKYVFVRFVTESLLFGFTSFYYGGWTLSLQKPTDELGRSYVSFMRVSLDQIRQKVADELYILTLFEASWCQTLHCIDTAAALAASPPASHVQDAGLVCQSLIGAAPAYLTDDCRLLSDVGHRPVQSSSNDMQKLHCRKHIN